MNYRRLHPRQHNPFLRYEQHDRRRGIIELAKWVAILALIVLAGIVEAWTPNF